jgi:hypothetical protein
VAAERPTRMTARLHDLRPEVEEEVKALPEPNDLLPRVRAVLAQRPELPREAAVPCVVEGKCRRLKRLSSANPFRHTTAGGPHGDVIGTVHSTVQSRFFLCTAKTGNPGLNLSIGSPISSASGIIPVRNRAIDRDRLNMGSRTGSRLVRRAAGRRHAAIVETRCERRRGHNLVSVARGALRAARPALVSHCCCCRRMRHDGLAACCCSTCSRHSGGTARDAKGCAAHSSVAGQKGRRPALCRERKSRRGFRKGTGGGASHKDPITGGIRCDGTSARRRGKTSYRACKRCAK